jgi:hypothetical protein
VVAPVFCRFDEKTGMADSREKIIPAQMKGAKKDVEHTVNASDDNDARKLFIMARNRLLDVNRWHEFAGKASAKFFLTDADENILRRTAQKGDFIKIDLPAVPGSQEGEGFDWVYIEAIDDQSNEEFIAMRVRPTSRPATGEKVAHFFKGDATSTFIVERDGASVTAGEFGRNEVPNSEAESFMDKVRNVIVGSTAIAGASDLQWKNLVKGILDAA